MHIGRSTSSSALALSLSFFAVACGGAAKKPKPQAPPDDVTLGVPMTFAVQHDGGSAASNAGADASCIVVQGDFAPQPTSAEGVLVKTTGKSAAPFVLRLARPRCVVGLERSSIITEVYVASTGADLRPLVDAHLRITGDAIAGTNDLGGPAVIVLAKELERLEPAAAP